MKKLLFVLLALISTNGYSQFRKFIMTPYRTLDQIDPQRNREYGRYCDLGVCNLVASFNPTGNDFDRIQLFVSDKNATANLKAKNFELPNPFTIYLVDQSTLDYMLSNSKQLVTPPDWKDTDPKIGQKAIYCAASIAGCGGSLISLWEVVAMSGIFGSISGCSAAYKDCDELMEAAEKDKEYFRKLHEYNKAVREGRVTPGGDPIGGGGTGAPVGRNPGATSGDAEAHPGMGGSVPCPKCKITDDPPPRHQE